MRPPTFLDPESDYLQPSFAEISAPTWRTLESCARDTQLMNELLSAMAQSGAFNAKVAVPAITTLLEDDDRLDQSVDCHDLACLLWMLLSGCLELHSLALFD